MIDLEFLTDEPDLIEIGKRYWQLGIDGAFHEDSTALVPWGSIRRLVLLEYVISCHVVARDTRRRCPICTMPEKLATRASFLEPVKPRSPCDDCRYLKRIAVDARGDEVSASFNDHGSAECTRFPAATLVSLEVLSQLLGPKLHAGFSIHECADYASAHVGRFIEDLRTANVLERTTVPTETGNAGGAVKFHLARNAELEDAFRAFTCTLTRRSVPDHGGLRELWLNHAVADCMRFLCNKSTLYGLPVDPEDEGLCSLLRDATSTWSVTEVCSVCLLAVRKAAELVGLGIGTKAALATVPDTIAAECSKGLEGRHASLPDVVGHSPGRLGSWFHAWFGIDRDTRGSAVTDAFASGQAGAAAPV